MEKSNVSSGLLSEQARLKELHFYNILDTKNENDFNDLVKLAAQVCGTPFALISFVDKERVWFKASVGVTIKEGPRSLSFCNHTIEHAHELIVNDLTQDERFKNSPLVMGPPFIKFYGGVPLVSSSGFRLGTVCVMDLKQRSLTDEQLSALKIIANQVMNLLNLRLNIHHLEAAKQKISENERRFMSLAQGSPVGIFQTDETGKGIYVNKKWRDIVGISEAQGYDFGWVAAIHPEDRQKFLKRWAHAFSSKTDFALRFRFQNSEKGTRWVKSHASPYYDERGNFIGYVGTLEDITKRKQAEDKLEESQRLFQLISTNSKDLLTIFEADESARCIYVSPSSKEVLGYEPEELMGLSPFEMMPPEQAQVLKEQYIPLILKGQSTRTENQLRKSDGSLIWVEALSKPIFDEHGRILTFQSSVREITERKKFEEQLREEKLKAEESARAKSLFLSTMSHEIRTPMNAVIGLTNLLMDENPRADQTQSLELLKFSGQNLMTLINDILDYNKIEAGKMEIEHIPFNVKSIVEKFVALSAPRAKSKEISFSCQLDERIPASICGDPTRLGQVLNNLIGNAIKFTNQGSVSVSAKVLEQNGDEYLLYFGVKDTGIGIAPGKQKRIFENFSQAEADVARKYGGTGLGLSISKKLLQLMGSEIQLNSVPGKGSEFYFELRCTASSVQNAQTETEAKEIVTRPLSILVAEDNKINQVVVTNFLEKWGMKVTIAENGLQAIEATRHEKFDAILMDLQMPAMDGFEATSEIRKINQPYYQAVPILALSASVLPEEKTRAQAKGFTDFISKPFQPEELKAKIVQYAGKVLKGNEIQEAA